MHCLINKSIAKLTLICIINSHTRISWIGHWNQLRLHDYMPCLCTNVFEVCFKTVRYIIVIRENNIWKWYLSYRSVLLDHDICSLAFWWFIFELSNFTWLPNTKEPFWNLDMPSIWVVVYSLGIFLSFLNFRKVHLICKRRQLHLLKNQETKSARAANDVWEITASPAGRGEGGKFASKAQKTKTVDSHFSSSNAVKLQTDLLWSIFQTLNTIFFHLPYKQFEALKLAYKQSELSPVFP